MGISANQARLLSLTARQHDLELRAQRISAEKMFTLHQSQSLALNYSNAITAYNNGRQGINTNYVTEDKDITLAWLNSKASKLRANQEYVLYNGTEGAALSSITTDEALLNALDNYGIVIKTTSVAGNTDKASVIVKYLKEITAEHTANSDWNVEITNSYSYSNGKYSLNINPNTTKSTNGSVQEYFVRDGVNVTEAISMAEAAKLNNNFKLWYLNYTKTLCNEDPTFDGSVSADELEARAQANGESIYGGTPSGTTTVSYSDYIIPVGTKTYEEKIPVSTQEVNESGINIQSVQEEYDLAMKELSDLEKILDMELTNINTEHQAVKTEYDSVKSLIKDNTEKSFNIFG